MQQEIDCPTVPANKKSNRSMPGAIGVRQYTLDSGCEKNKAINVRKRGWEKGKGQQAWGSMQMVMGVRQ